MIDISIIIVNYNVKEYIVDCIQSIIRWTPETIQYEIIVVDDNSSDGTRDIILNHKHKNELLELIPGGDSGLQIMKFINASVISSKNNSIWTDLNSI